MLHAVVSMGVDGSALSAAALALFTRILGRIFAQKPSSKQASVGNIVSQFKKDRLPLRMMVNWNRIITDPAICRPILGQKTNTGATISAKKLNQTPIFK